MLYVKKHHVPTGRLLAVRRVIWFRQNSVYYEVRSAVSPLGRHRCKPSPSAVRPAKLCNTAKAFLPVKLVAWLIRWEVCIGNPTRLQPAGTYSGSYSTVSRARAGTARNRSPFSQFEDGHYLYTRTSPLLIISSSCRHQKRGRRHAPAHPCEVNARSLQPNRRQKLSSSNNRLRSRTAVRAHKPLLWNQKNRAAPVAVRFVLNVLPF
jgi:hypothetical protein